MVRFLVTGLLAIACFALGPTLKGQTLTLNYFNASPDGSDVLVSWEIPSEAGVSMFKLYRQIEGESNFKFLENIEPDGSLAYQHLDYTLYKDNPRAITYKLIVQKTGVVYTYYANILHNPTSVQRTWGSIKAMFRD